MALRATKGDEDARCGRRLWSFLVVCGRRTWRFRCSSPRLQLSGVSESMTYPEVPLDFEPRGLAGARFVDHEGGRHINVSAVGRKGGSHDRAGVNRQRGADARDIEHMVVAVTDHIEFARGDKRAGDAVVVIHGEAPTVEFAAKQFAVEADVLVIPRVGGDAVEVAIVVAEHDGDGPGESLAQLLDY